MTTNSYVTNEVIRSMKHHSYSFGTIGAFFLLFPLGLDLLKSNTIHKGIKAMASYPMNVVTLGIYGGLFGFIVGVQQHQNEFSQKFPDYTIAIISAVTDELCLYSSIKLREISKKIQKTG